MSKGLFASLYEPPSKQAAAQPKSLLLPLPVSLLGPKVKPNLFADFLPGEAEITTRGYGRGITDTILNSIAPGWQQSSSLSSHSSDRSVDRELKRRLRAQRSRSSSSSASWNNNNSIIRDRDLESQVWSGPIKFGRQPLDFGSFKNSSSSPVISFNSNLGRSSSVSGSSRSSSVPSFAHLMGEAIREMMGAQPSSHSSTTSSSSSSAPEPAVPPRFSFPTSYPNPAVGLRPGATNTRANQKKSS